MNFHISSILCWPSASKVTRNSHFRERNSLRKNENPVSSAAHAPRLIGWRITEIVSQKWLSRSSEVPSVDPSSTTRIWSNQAKITLSITEIIRVDSLYDLMRKRILFFCARIVCILESELTSELCNLLLCRIYFSKEKKHKVKEKNNTTIDKDISSARKPENMSDKTECLRNKGEEKESSSDSEKNQKMERIKSLPFCNIECNNEYDNSGNDEEYLEEVHGQRRKEK